MTILRYIRSDEFGIRSAFEVNDGFIDLIVAGSKSATDAQTHGTLTVLCGEHETLDGWTASRPADAVIWVLACVAEPTPRNLIAYVSAIELDQNGEVPEALSHEIFDGDGLATGVEFRLGDIVRLLDTDMIVQGVAGSTITCARVDAPGSLSETYPATTLGLVAAGSA